MGFLSYNMEYFRRELDALEIGFPTTEKVYHAQQLYRILEDLAAEGYHQLNELLETEKCGIPCCRLPTIRLGKEGAFIRGC